MADSPSSSPSPDRPAPSRRRSLKVIATSVTGAIACVAVLLSNLETITNFIGRLRGETGVSLIVSVADLKPGPQDVDCVDVPYHQQTKGSWLEITPAGDYFQALHDNQPARSHWHYDEYFNVAPAGLDVRLINNSGKVIAPHQITLEIARSRPDHAPLLYPVNDPMNLLSVTLNNEGWGKIESMDIAYALVPANAPANPMPAVLPHHVRLTRPAYDQAWDFFITDALIAEGAPAELTHHLMTLEKQRRAAPDSEYEAIEPVLKQLRQTTATWNQRFNLQTEETGGITVVGKTTCTWRDHDDSLKTSIVTFAATANLTIPDGLGAAALEVADQVDFELPIRADNLRLSRPLARVLSGADADRYTVKLSSKQSAVHEFRVRVSYDADQEAVSEWIRFHYLLPTSNAQLIEAQRGDRASQPQP